MTESREYRRQNGLGVNSASISCSPSTSDAESLAAFQGHGSSSMYSDGLTVVPNGPDRTSTEPMYLGQAPPFNYASQHGVAHTRLSNNRGNAMSVHAMLSPTPSYEEQHFSQS
jgi:hypothetical protein